MVTSNLRREPSCRSWLTALLRGLRVPVVKKVFYSALFSQQRDYVVGSNDAA